MRLVAWNVFMGLDGPKAERLMALSPDVAVISESAQSTALARRGGVTHRWVGTNRSKGLGVYAFGSWRLADSALPADSSGFVLPVQVDGPRPFTLLALWAQKDTTMPAKQAYVCRLERLIDTYGNAFGQGDVVVAGDFNASDRFDGRMSQLADRMRSHGLVSAYHQYAGCAVSGVGEAPTWFNQYNAQQGWHFDYVFVPSHWTVTSATVGTYEDWVAAGVPGRSDHTPVVVDVDTRGTA